MRHINATSIGPIRIFYDIFGTLFPQKYIVDDITEAYDQRKNITPTHKRAPFFRDRAILYVSKPAKYIWCTPYTGKLNDDTTEITVDTTLDRKKRQSRLKELDRQRLENITLTYRDSTRTWRLRGYTDPNPLKNNTTP